MRASPAHVVALSAVAIAAALHVYEQLAKSSAPSVGWFLWSMLPYALCLIVLLRSRSGVPAALGAGVALALDLFAHYDVFVHPTGSTAALALIFVPLWSALIFAPVAMLVAWLFVRRRVNGEQHAA